MTLNDDMETIWIAVVMISFEVISWILPGQHEYNHEEPQHNQPSARGFKQTSHIQRSTNVGSLDISPQQKPHLPTLF
jgi:hypothetical protein